MDRNWLFTLSIPVAAAITPAYAVDYLSVEEAQHILFPEAQEFVRLPIRLNDEQLSEIRHLAGVRQREDEPKIWEAKLDGQSLGWFFVDNVVGKHEFITYGAALSPEGEVVGIEIMSYRETHGGEVRDAEWRAFFEGKTLDDEFKLNRDIPNISGATLSCRNLTDGVKRLLALQQVVLMR